MQHFVFLLFLVAGSWPAYSATVRQLLNEQNLSVLELEKSEKAAVGEHFLAPTSHTQCLMEVLASDKRMVTVSTKRCPDKTGLAIGTKVEKLLVDSAFLEQMPNGTVTQPSGTQADKTPLDEPANPPKSAAAIQTEKLNLYVALNVGLTFSGKMKYDFKAYNGLSSDTGDVEFDLDNAVKLGVEISTFDKNSWNPGFKIDYVRFPIGSVAVHTNNSGNTSGKSDGSLGLLSAGFVTKYRYEQFYFPLEAALVSSSNDSTFAQTKTIKSAVFISLGLGFVFAENFAAELTSNAYSIKADLITSSGTTIDPSYGYLNFLQLTGKFMFR